VAGRAIEATQASHPDSISISGGKLATLTKHLVSMIVCLSGLGSVLHLHDFLSRTSYWVGCLRSGHPYFSLAPVKTGKV
jgi:hypothetical protein